MIALIRRRFGKQAFNFIIWITILSLVGGMFVSSFIRKFSGAALTSVGEVNGYEISPREFQRQMRLDEQRISQIRQMYGKNASLFLQVSGLTGKAEDRVIKTLITQKLLLAAGDKMGVVLSPEYVTSQLHNPETARQLLQDFVPPYLMTDKGINYAEVLKVLQRQGISASMIEEIVEERIKQGLVVNLATSSAYIPEFLIKQTFDKAYRSRKYLIVKIPLSAYIKKEQESKAKISEDTLKKFYEEHKNRVRHYYKNEKRGARVWKFESVPQGFVTEGETAIAKGGGIFDEFVKKYKGIESIVPVTERKQDPIISKLFTLNQGGRGIGMIDDKKGFVVEATMLEPEALLPYESVKDKVLEDYYKVQAGNKLFDDLEILKGLEPAKRSAWVKEHQGTEKVTGFVNFDKSDSYKEFQKDGVPVNQLRELETPGDRIAATNQDGFMIELLEFDTFDQKAFEEKKSELQHSLERQEAERVTLGFIASLEKNAKIKRNLALFNRR